LYSILNYVKYAFVFFFSPQLSLRMGWNLHWVTMVCLLWQLFWVFQISPLSIEYLHRICLNKYLHLICLNIRA